MSTVVQSASNPISTESIRNQFPALERRHNDHPVAYFDGAGGTQTPRVVVEAVADYLVNHNANTHWEYPTSHETDAIIESARHAFADFLNASANEIVFGPNTTTMIYHLSRALGRTLGPGDEIVITELEHHANVAPWQALVVERGVRLNIAQMDPETGQLDWSDFDRLVTKKTKVVAFGAGCNALGTVNNYRGAVELAHSVGALALVDAVHYAPYFLCDVKETNCDFLTCSAYKFYGPHVSVFYGKKDLLEAVDFPKLQPAPDTAPERAEMGTQNHEGIAGAAAAVDFYASLAGHKTARVSERVSTGSGPGSLRGQPAWGGGSDRVKDSTSSRRANLQSAFKGLRAHSAPQVKRLWESLSGINGVRLYGPPPEVERTPTVSFTMKNVASTEVARRLAEQGLFASHGDFYAQTVIERLGLQPEGLVRVGCACYTSDDEIERLIEAVHRIALGS
ncbi:MAG TPA: aminotransferase class V-fold PLP-dependent enzyme [Pyrinomonadaceae bacterium]|nr:aminotransferase class V-fold PLP-dependent enzyme [Pyrinomonadaceae bacterium]